MTARLSYRPEPLPGLPDDLGRSFADLGVEHFARNALTRFTEYAAEHFIENLTRFIAEDLPDAMAKESSLTLAKAWTGESIAEQPASTLVLSLSLGDRDRPLEFFVDLAEVVTDALRLHTDPDTGLLSPEPEDRQALEAIADMLKTQAARIEHALNASREQETTHDL